MKPLDIFFLVGTLLSLFWGYKSYIASRAELLRIRNRKRLPRLRRELALIERLHSSPSERVEYMLQTVLFCLGALGALLMFSSSEFVAYNAGFSAAIRWFGGGFVYLFTAYRLGRCNAATVRYTEVVQRLAKAIADAEKDA